MDASDFTESFEFYRFETINGWPDVYTIHDGETDWVPFTPFFLKLVGKRHTKYVENKYPPNTRSPDHWTSGDRFAEAVRKNSEFTEFYDIQQFRNDAIMVSLRFAVVLLRSVVKRKAFKYNADNLGHFIKTITDHLDRAKGPQTLYAKLDRLEDLIRTELREKTRDDALRMYFASDVFKKDRAERLEQEARNYQPIFEADLAKKVEQYKRKLLPKIEAEERAAIVDRLSKDPSVIADAQRVAEIMLPSKKRARLEKNPEGEIVLIE